MFDVEVGGYNLEIVNQGSQQAQAYSLKPKELTAVIIVLQVHGYV